VEFSRYLQVLRKRKWIIALTALITVGVVLLNSLRLPPTYTSVARLRVTPLGINGPDYGTVMYFERLANTYFEIMRSDFVKDEAAKRLGVKKLPDFRIEAVPQTELMRLSVDAESPKLAQDAANTLATILVEQNQALFQGDGSGIQSVLRKRLTDIEAELKDLAAERVQLMAQVPRDDERISAIERTIDAKQQTYNLTLSSYNQALVSQSTMASALTILEAPTLPTGPSGPQRTRDSVLAGIVGLLGGVALAFVFENLNSRMYTYKEVQAVTQAPVLGKIPHISGRNRANVFQSDPMVAEAFRRLRTNLFALGRNAPMRVLLITSAVPQDGKSTTAANLALAFAQTQQQVILVDCDMRLPTLHKIFGLPNQAGLSTVLGGHTSLESALGFTKIPQLKVLTAGAPVYNSAELLGSRQMAALVGQLSMVFDVIVLDGPPLLPVIDSAVLAPFVNGVLMVVDQSKSDQEAVTTACEQLETVGANLLGVVVNRVREDSKAYQNAYYARRPS
jgi:capsular exopolysaccharide synthesis family protein